MSDDPQRYSWKSETALVAVLLLLCGLLPPVPVFSAQVSADSLIGYWKFDETSGTSAADSSGDGRTGTFVGSPAISSTLPTLGFTNTRSLQFGATTSDAVSVTANAALNTWTTGMTFSIWFKRDETGTGEHGLITNSDVITLAINGNKIYFWLPGQSILISNTSVNNTSWHHVAGVFDNTNNTTKIYLDGTLDTSMAETHDPSAPSANFIIGNEAAVSTRAFSGNLDDARAYNRALFPWEITDLAAGDHTRAYWRGKAGTGFEHTQSWSGSYIPDPYSRIVLRASTGSLTLTGAISVAGLTVNTGALFSVNGANLTMNDAGIFTNYGTFALKNTETLTSVTPSTDKGSVMLIGTGSTTGLKTGNSYYNFVVNDGLLSYLKFDETSGTKAADSSGYTNSGVLINGPSISTTVAPLRYTNARSLSFDGSNDKVTVSGSILSNLQQFTLSGWVRPTSAGSRIGFFGQNDVIEFGFIDSSHILCYSANGAQPSWAFTSTTFPMNIWHHVACTGTSKAVQLYVDGVLVKGGVVAVSNYGSDTDPFNIGGSVFDSTGNNFTGTIDDVRVYKRALSSGEIAALAAGSEPSVAQGLITLNAALDVNNNLSLNAGALDASSGNYGITVGGSWLNNGGVFTARQGTVTFDGTSSALQVLSGGQQFNALTLNGSSATWTLLDRLTATGTLTLSNGALDVSTGNYALRAGTVTQTSGTFTPRSGLLILTSPSSATATISSTLSTLAIEDSTENGLVGYWKLDEGTNTGAILDSSGKNNTGVRHGSGGLVWTGSTLSSQIAFDNPLGMIFDGTNDFVSASTSGFNTGTSSRTIAGWIRADTSSTTRVPFAYGDCTSASKAFGLYLSTANVLNFWGCAAADFSTSTTLTANTWYHVGATYDGTNVRVYVNGSQVGSTTARTLASSTAYMEIGGAHLLDSGNYWFPGIIDDVRVYSRMLSATEMKNLYNGTYADGDTSTATFSLGGNLTASTVTILSGNLGGSSRSISVSGDWNNYSGTGGFVYGTSTVDLNGSSTQNVRGSTNFYRLEASTTSAQTVKFGSGTTQGILNYLTLTGQSSNLLTLSPITSPYPWSINLDSAASQLVQYVSPSYANASPGAVIVANDGTSINGGNDTNWQFGNPTVSFQLSSLTKSETSGSASLVINLSGSSLLNITVPYSISGTATGTGTDYTLFTPSPIRLNAGETSTGIIILFNNDSTVESDETIVFTLGTPTNGTLGSTGTLTLTLTSDDSLSSSSSSSSSSNQAAATGGGHKGSGGPGGAFSSDLAQKARIAIADRFKSGIFDPNATAVVKREPEKKVAVESVPLKAAAPEAVPAPVAPLVPNLTRIAEQRGRLLVKSDEGSVLYRDVLVTEWYAPFVAAMVEEGVAQGYRDADGKLTGEFGVGKAVTRAEVLKMALEAMNVTLAGKPPRSVSAIGSWASAYVGEAEEMGIDVFTPDLDVHAPATRGEVVQILLEAMKLPIGKSAATFIDVPTDHPYSRAIATAAFYGLVEGDTNADGTPKNTFRPDATINRAETAKIVAVLQELLK